MVRPVPLSPTISLTEADGESRDGYRQEGSCAGAPGDHLCRPIGKWVAAYVVDLGDRHAGENDRCDETRTDDEVPDTRAQRRNPLSLIRATIWMTAKAPNAMNVTAKPTTMRLSRMPWNQS